jgi:hypothetical protein
MVFIYFIESNDIQPFPSKTKKEKAPEMLLN